MLRAVYLLATIIAVGCDPTEPNVVPCGDDCPDISGGGRSGEDGGSGRAGRGGAGAAGMDAGASGAAGTGGGLGGDSGAGDGATGGDAGDAGSDPDGGDCGDCPVERPHCHAGQCVACVEDGDCGTGVCEQSACVPCRQDSDCTDPATSRCSTQQCTACLQNEHCTHIDGKSVCDSGECVQCTGPDSEPCGFAGNGAPYVCDALMRTCSMSTRRSAGLCDPCVSDDQCGAGQLCVMQYFDEASDTEGEVEVGYFCFWREDATEGGAPAGDCVNARPYVDTRAGSESIEGTEATVCGLAVTTCAGYKDYRTKSCTGLDDDASCGDARFASDGYCEMFSASMYRCTTPCGSDDDCRTGFTCNISGSPEYCALQ